jgi:hypothetical protein
MKRAREAKLPRGRWEKKLKLDKEGRVRPILFNLSLILREGPDWEGSIGFDEFAARVVIKGITPLEGSAPGTPCSRH